MNAFARIPGGAALVMAAALISGCGSMGNMFGDSDNRDPPMPLPEISPSRTLTEVWSTDVGAGAGKKYLKLTPAVAEGRVFAAEVDGDVAAFDLRSGERLWQQDTDRSISGGPGTGEGLVLVGTIDGEVVALEADSGEQRWVSRVSSEVLSPPLARDGVVVVRTHDGKLEGLDTNTGKRLWVYDRTVPALSLRGTSTPAFSGDAVVAGFDSGRMVSLALSTGQLLWESRVAVARGRSELERLVDIDSDPVVSGGEIYVVSFQGQVASLDVLGGELLWQRDMSSHAGLAVQGQSVYLTDEQSQVWALDRDSGASLWRHDELQRRALTQPAAVADAVLVGDFEGYLHVLDASDGRLLARTRVDGDGIATAPLVVDDLIVVYGRGGSLSVLRLE
jgi:outer membrane protein assembly factor BamB